MSLGSSLGVAQLRDTIGPRPSATPNQRGRLADGKVRLPAAKMGLSAQAAGSTSKARPPTSAGGRLSRPRGAAAARAPPTGAPPPGGSHPRAPPPPPPARPAAP